MNIIINGQKKNINSGLNIEMLLRDEGYANKKVAVALNGEFVPKGNHAATQLNDHDEIEIVAPMQGG